MIIHSKVRTTVMCFGQLDILVNNAGMGIQASRRNFHGQMGCHHARERQETIHPLTPVRKETQVEISGIELEMHIDTDEVNAAGVPSESIGQILGPSLRSSPH